MSKHLTKFDTLAEYNNEKYFLDFPNVSKVNGSVYYLPSMPTDYAILWKDENGNALGLTTCGTTASRPSTIQAENVYSIEWGSCDSVTTLGDNLFYGTNISTVSIPATVTTVGNSVYAACNNITSVTIPATVTTVGNSMFDYCSKLASVTLPNGLTNMGNYMFRNCTSLASITIPNSVTTIGDQTFSDCSNLSSVVMPSSPTSIGSSAFSRCTSLTSLTIPNTVTSIGYQAFFSSGITSFTIPASVTNIGNGALGSNACTSITVDSNNTYYDSRDNCNAVIRTSTNQLVAGCVNTVIPSTVTSMAQYAFANAPITSIGITGSGADIEIPSTVTVIPRELLGSSYEERTSLVSVVLHSGVTAINPYAFANNKNLTSFTCMATNPPSASQSILDRVSNNLVIYVPAESVNAYKAANGWKDFKNKIQAIPA